MKKIFNFLFITIALASVTPMANAGKNKLNEAKIIYDISYPGTELDQNMMAMMPSEATLYVKKDMSRMEMKTGIGSTITISNAKDQTAVTLMDMMGSKMAIKASKDDMKKELDKSGKPEVKITDETKEIAGYTCTKAIVTTTVAGEKQTHNVWFTKDIEAGNVSKYHIEGIDGFMMEYEVKAPGMGMNMKLTVRSVEAQPVDDSLFKIPEGYKETTMDEMRKNLGGH